MYFALRATNGRTPSVADLDRDLNAVYAYSPDGAIYHPNDELPQLVASGGDYNYFYTGPVAPTVGTASAVDLKDVLRNAVSTYMFAHTCALDKMPPDKLPDDDLLDSTVPPGWPCALTDLQIRGFTYATKDNPEVLAVLDHVGRCGLGDGPLLVIDWTY